MDIIRALVSFAFPSIETSCAISRQVHVGFLRVSLSSLESRIGNAMSYGNLKEFGCTIEFNIAVLV